MEVLTAMKKSASGAKTAAQLLIRRRKVASDFRRSRARFLEATGSIAVETAAHHIREVPPLTPEEKQLLLDVSLNVDPFDTMYVPGKEDHYLLVGLSAITLH